MGALPLEDVTCGNSLSAETLAHLCAERGQTRSFLLIHTCTTHKKLCVFNLKLECFCGARARRCQMLGENFSLHHTQQDLLPGCPIVAALSASLYPGGIYFMLPSTWIY